MKNLLRLRMKRRKRPKRRSKKALILRMRKKCSQKKTIRSRKPKKL